MQNVVNYVKQYIGVISIVLAICILLTYSFSYFKVNIDNERAAEMYMGELEYSILIDNKEENTITVEPNSQKYIDLGIIDDNKVNSYYKLLYENNKNVTIEYLESVTYYYKEISDETNSIYEGMIMYMAPNGLINVGSGGNVRLRITNNSSSAQTITFKVSGGYSTNTLADVEVPSGYTNVDTEGKLGDNELYCEIENNSQPIELSQGSSYTFYEYTYNYKQKGTESSSELTWEDITDDGWGVQLTDKASTNAVTSNICTYMNSQPIVNMSNTFSNSKASSISLKAYTNKVTDMSNMFSKSEATQIDLSNINTSKVTNMESMFNACLLETLDLSNFDTSNVTNMSHMFEDNTNLTTIYATNKFDTSNVTNSDMMFNNTTNLIGANGTKYDTNYIDKTYARIDAESIPGYFTLKSN